MRLDTNAWSAEVPITSSITLSDLAPGAHYVEVVGKNDAGFFQDDSAFGPAALVTRSKTWVVQAVHPPFEISAIQPAAGGVAIRFQGLAGNSYRVEWNSTLNGGQWQPLTNVSVLTASGEVVAEDGGAGQARFYRVVTP